GTVCAPLVGLPQRGHGAYEVVATGAPHHAQNMTSIVTTRTAYHIMPSCSFAASDIMLRSHTGSNTTSTSASFTSGSVSTLCFTSAASTGPMPQPGAVSVILIFTS